MIRTLPLNRLLLLALLAAATVAHAQSPAAAWRTIETPHFRVHYPREYEEWSARAAGRLESIREAVSAEAGFTPPQKIDVLVMNPIAQANGSAWPFLDTPRMIFFTEPPGPDEQIGAYGSWIDLLAVHETTHLVHMLRPTRNPLGRVFEKYVLPLDPITLRAPRWVLEGYATVVEGRLTGTGRPTSTIRALILRRWAAEGNLPTYDQMASDSRSFLGMSMAYLMGSAYLEWLEQRSGPDSLRKLWSRLTARHRRSFDTAFAGVFGDDPERLYGRFVAELTASAMTIDRAAPLQEGTLFQETPRASGDPAVSPDGKQLAVVVREREKPQKLVIWSTGAPEEEEKKFSERLQKILARDPEDVPPVRTKPLPRKAVHELVMPDGGDIDNPRWTRDGKAIVFSHRVPDAEGFLHYDLYRWDFDRLTRITHLADVHDADPIDANRAIAVRSRFGTTQLVYVNLTTGEVTRRTDPSIDIIVSHPRVSADGHKTAWVEHNGATWFLVVVDDRSATDFRYPMPNVDAASPEWLNDDEVVHAGFSRGFAELYRHRITEREPVQITRAAGGAFSPAPSPDGRIFFMSLDPDGYVVRVLDRIEPLPATPPLEASLVPAIPPAPRTPATFATQTVTSRPYGLGRQEFGWFTGQSWAPHQQAFELGVRFGDVVGRLDTLLIGSLGRGDAPDGASLATAWRGWPVELHAHLFASDVPDVVTDRGAEVRAVYSRTFPQSRMTVEAGALANEFAFGRAELSTRQQRGASRFDQALTLEADDEHYRGILAASLGSSSFRIGARYQHDGGTPITLGGIASSVLPRSAYSRRVLDPALPVALLSGDDYDGWRIEATVASPITLFYQRHELGETQLSLTGIEATLSTDPTPILKSAALDLTLGVARVLDAPLRGETKWWFSMRWRP
ncbi:MAG: hypothetical protein M3Q69_12705 [Acidobacteriota bacterium]|nr:hypothetical protein [Acidobacteriota bacterium]